VTLKQWREFAEPLPSLSALQILVEVFVRLRSTNGVQYLRGSARLFRLSAMKVRGRSGLFSAARFTLARNLADRGVDTVGMARSGFHVACVVFRKALGDFLLALPQQCDFGWCQSSRFGRGTELLIQ